MNRNTTASQNCVVKLIIINAIVFFIQYFISPDLTSLMSYYLGLVPALVVDRGFVWQIFSYMFLHGGFFHLFLNMYALMIFGMPIEQAWGSKRLLFYYLFTGVGAGITIFIINYFIIGGTLAFVPTIGASGAVFGLLLAFGMLFPEAQILLFFVVPIRAKYLVVLYGAFELYALISSGGGSNISHVGHLGGLLFGLIYFAFTKKHSLTLKSKKFRTKISKELEKREEELFSNSAPGDELLLDILKKLRESGVDSLTDDEFQHIRYVQIMVEDEKNLCVEQDFNADDEYCKKCENLDACLIRELKKHLK